jgi:hypothetical protein
MLAFERCPPTNSNIAENYIIVDSGERRGG